VCNDEVVLIIDCGLYVVANDAGDPAAGGNGASIRVGQEGPTTSRIALERIRVGGLCLCLCFGLGFINSPEV
jgi:hypothetical protein